MSPDAAKICANTFFRWSRDFGLTSRILICFCASTAHKTGKEICKSELCALAGSWSRHLKAEMLLRGAVQMQDLVRTILNMTNASAALLLCKLLGIKYSHSLYTGKLSFGKINIFSICYLEIFLSRVKRSICLG